MADNSFKGTVESLFKGVDGIIQDGRGGCNPHWGYDYPAAG